jgi:hypothetical protein
VCVCVCVCVCIYSRKRFKRALKETLLSFTFVSSNISVLDSGRLNDVNSLGIEKA